MPRTDEFIEELEREAGPTRRALERIPEDQLSWKPHPKSLSLGQLGHHVAVLPGAISELVSELTREPPNVPRPEPSTVAEILASFDESVARARTKLAAFSDEDLAQTWRLVRNGATIIERPRGAVIRSVMLNHWYHHRGQLSVYLRLLDVPVPSIYGPTADESPF